MALTNARIDQLPLLSSPLKANFPIPIRNLDSGVTEQVDIGNFLPSEQTQNFEWVSDTEYDEDESVTWGGKLWQSTIDGNIGITPGTNPDDIDPAPWIEIPKGSAGLSYWKAAGYVQDEVFVINDYHGNTLLFRLKNTARPFISADFLAEYNAGDWEIVGVEKTKTINISAAELATCGSVPVDLLPLIMEDILQSVAAVSIKYVYGTVAYDFAAFLVLKYAGAAVANFILNDDLNAAADFFKTYNRQGEYETDLANFVLTTEDGSDPTTGDGTLVIKLYYRINNFN